MTFITHGFRVSVVSDVRERVRDFTITFALYVKKNPGRFAPGRFAPLNRYNIIIDEIFFDNFWEIIYLLVVCKKNNNSFILVYFKYLFISCTYKKNNNSFILVYFCQRSQVKLFLQNLQNQHTRTVKRLGFLFVPTQKCMK